MGSLLAASYYHDGYILANWLKDPVIDPNNQLYDFLWPEAGTKAMSSVDSKIFEFLWRDPELKPQSLTDLPLSRYYDSPYGWMTARTGWDENSVIAQMRVNIYNFGGHQHADAGSFELYYKGPLAIHSGVYQGVNGGFGGAHHRNFYQRTIAHNSLLIYDPDETFGQAGGKALANDGVQRIVLKEPLVLKDIQQPAHETGVVLARGFGPDEQHPAYTYLKGDITRAYSSKVREVKRSQVFLNLGWSDSCRVDCFDRVVASNPTFRKFWLLQGAVEPAIDGDTQSVIARIKNGWNGKLVNTTLLPRGDNASIEKVGGPGKEFWVFGKNYPNATVPPDPEAGGWRVEISPRKPAASDLFLNVMQVMDRSVSEPARCREESSPARLPSGVRIANRVVIFNSTQDKEQGPVSFQAAGSGGVGILLTDMAEGNWRIEWKGRPVRSLAIDASGTTYFEGPVGSYRLVRVER